MDKCGVCGGDNTGCQVVSGVFKHALTSLGYHRVVEIPQGATKINITEMHKSNNYLGEFTYLLHTAQETVPAGDEVSTVVPRLGGTKWLRFIDLTQALHLSGKMWS